MAKLSPNLQHLTDELPADKRKDIEEAIASSPYLRQIMTEAVNAGTLEHIRMGVPGANEGGHFNARERAIYLSPETFTRAAFKQDAEARHDMITSTLGHETGHALYKDKARKELYFTTGSITEGIRAAGPGGEFDATGLVGAYIRDARRNEAQAEIHGWNSLASRIEYVEGKPPSRNEMLERALPTTHCVDGTLKNLRLETGIILDADMHMSDTRLPKAGQINLEPVAQCHFDKSGKSLGADGAANYTNYYGAYLVQQLADDTSGWVNPPTIKLNMEKLGLDKAQLESTGLRLSNDGFSLVDTSQGRYKPLTLHSSGSGIHGTPDDIELALNDVRARQAPPSPQAESLPPPPMRDPRDPNDPDHRLYKQIEQGVHRIDADLGRTPDAGSERLAMETFVAAKAQGITSVDHVALSQQGAKHNADGALTQAGVSLFVVQGRDPYDERNKVAMVSTQAANNTPVEQSLQKLETLNQQQAQTLAQQQNNPRQDDPAPKGPKL